MSRETVQKTSIGIDGKANEFVLHRARSDLRVGVNIVSVSHNLDKAPAASRDSDVSKERGRGDCQIAGIQIFQGGVLLEQRSKAVSHSNILPAPKGKLENISAIHEEGVEDQNRNRAARLQIAQSFGSVGPNVLRVSRTSRQELQVELLSGVATILKQLSVVLSNERLFSTSDSIVVLSDGVGSSQLSRRVIRRSKFRSNERDTKYIRETQGSFSFADKSLEFRARSEVARPPSSANISIREVISLVGLSRPRGSRYVLQGAEVFAERRPTNRHVVSGLVLSKIVDDLVHVIELQGSILISKVALMENEDVLGAVPRSALTNEQSVLNRASHQVPGVDGRIDERVGFEIESFDHGHAVVVVQDVSKDRFRRSRNSGPEELEGLLLSELVLELVVNAIDDVVLESGTLIELGDGSTRSEWIDLVSNFGRNSECFVQENVTFRKLISNSRVSGVGFVGHDPAAFHELPLAAGDELAQIRSLCVRCSSIGPPLMEVVHLDIHELSMRMVDEGSDGAGQNEAHLLFVVLLIRLSSDMAEMEMNEIHDKVSFVCEI